MCHNINKEGKSNEEKQGKTGSKEKETLHLAIELYCVEKQGESEKKEEECTYFLH